MSTQLLETLGLNLLDGDASPEEHLRWQVREMLSGLYPVGPYERRTEQRYPYPKLIRLMPTTSDGLKPLGPTIVVSGKHLSETGLSFFHPNPLPYRLVIAVLETAEREKYGFLLDVDWCRFTQLGWYESGGKFLRTVELRDAA